MPNPAHCSASPVALVPAAQPAVAEAHFAGRLAFETDCADVAAARDSGASDFVLLDVRSRALFDVSHVPGAVSLPHAELSESTLAAYPEGTLFVVYCAGPHCNGANRAALALARLGRPVKEMIGGILGWQDEGFEVVR